MAITMKEIARLAGTSRGTVDRVVNGRGRVKKELSDKILQIAKENNYVANPAAKMLVSSQKKFIIGVVINSIGNEYFDDVITGIKSAGKEWKNNISIKMIQLEGYNVDSQLDAINQLCESGIDALAITPVDMAEISKKINDLSGAGLPVVLINSDIENTNRMAMVGSDNRQNGEMAGNLAVLVLPKKSNIAIVTGSYNNPSNKKRVVGFTQAINNSGKKLKIVDIVENHDNNENSYKAVKDLIASNLAIDFIYFCAGGISGGLKAIEESGKDIHAMTVDMCEGTKRCLESGLVYATITQDPFQQGNLPIEVLVDCLVFGKRPKQSKIRTENRIILKANL